jgi:hypothetical protein
MFEVNNKLVTWYVGRVSWKNKKLMKIELVKNMESKKVEFEKNNGWNEMLERLYWWDIWIDYICLKLGKIQDETQVMIDGNFKKA